MKKGLYFKLFLCCFLVSCGGGGGGSDAEIAGNSSCDGSCSRQNLTISDVTVILQRAISATNQLSTAGTFAVLDRVGNVLAVYQMPGAPTSSVINGQIGASGGLEGASVPATLAAISKGGTGAYLSSQGNAFSTRTASQIIQENFNPGERNQPGGPLFGVQFSQLPCSDLLQSSLGPRPLPLGLAADPGGIPLYKDGDVVGGLGVEFDGSYSLDRDIMDTDDSPEERVAIFAAIPYAAPTLRQANKIHVGGKSLRFSDVGYQETNLNEEELIPLDNSHLVSVSVFSNGQLRSGVTYGEASSGILQNSRVGVPAAYLVDSAGNPRFPTIDGASLPGAIQLRASEVDAILDSAILTANRARAAIRRPLDTPAQVSIWIVDTLGLPIGFARTADAPIFGIDVALQKARTAAFFSSADTGQKLDSLRSRNQVGQFEDYVQNARTILGSAAMTGQNAFTDRANGNLSRPFLPDGINGSSNGPLSLPFPGTSNGRTWSPFNDGLQLDLIFQRLVAPLGIPSGVPSISDTCTDKSVLGKRLGNGIQIFPGSVPLYRGATLIGAIGISGDGIDQDDMVAFFGASRQGLDYAGHTSVGDTTYGFNAPKEIRADQLTLSVSGLRLRYVNCPESPFIGTEDSNVCEGL